MTKVHMHESVKEYNERKFKTLKIYLFAVGLLMIGIYWTSIGMDFGGLPTFIGVCLLLIGISRTLYHKKKFKH